MIHHTVVRVRKPTRCFLLLFFFFGVFFCVILGLLFCFVFVVVVVVVVVVGFVCFLSSLFCFVFCCLLFLGCCFIFVLFFCLTIVIDCGFARTAITVDCCAFLKSSASLELDCLSTIRKILLHVSTARRN